MITSVTSNTAQPTTLMSNGELERGYYHIIYQSVPHIVYVFDKLGERMAIALDDPDLYWLSPFKLNVVKSIQNLQLIAD